MVMVIFTICCLILIAIVWPRAFFGTLGVLLVALILGIGALLIESPDDEQATVRQAAPKATFMPRSKRASARRKKSPRQTTGRAKRSRPWSCGVEQ